MSKMANEQETERLQQQLQSLLNEVGWDIKRLALELSIADDTSEVRNDIDPDREYEKIRKAMSRSTTKPATLNSYINFVIENNRGRQLYRMPKLSLSNLKGDVDWEKICHEVGIVSQQYFIEKNKSNQH